MDPAGGTSTAGVPHASVRAERAAWYARPPVLAVNGAAKPPGCTLTCAPQGAWASRCAVSAARAAAGSSPGAIRMLTLARAAGTRVLGAVATGGASTPVTAMAGAAHRRLRD